MNSLYALTAGPAAVGLGQALFHFLWQGTLIALVLAGVLRLLDPVSARARYGLACAAMLAMPGIFAVTLAVSIPEVTSTTAVQHYGGIFPLATVPSAGWLDPIAQPVRDRLSWVVPFWMVGVLLFYARSLGGAMAAQRWRRVGVVHAPEAWRQRLRDLAGRLHVGRPVALLESCLAEVPVVIGAMRPAILLPAGILAGMPAEQIEAILIHELAHIRRWDYAVNLIECLVEGLLFYHPATWWVSGVVRQERENCCDDEVVRQGRDARRYAAALVELEEDRWAAGGAALAATGGSLRTRIGRLLHEPKRARMASAPVVAAALVAVLTGITLVAFSEEPVTHQAPDKAAASRPMTEKQRRQREEKLRNQLETPYRKWLNEDVVYIIKPGERIAFEHLKSDGEREHFIEQFWLRRDPTPNTTENEFKEELYRRIARANDRFQAGVPGWKTDRGRIYITFGPPDEIEAHPQGSPPRPPYEIWLYRRAQGLGENVKFEFVDTDRTGDYRVTKRP